MIQEIWFGDCLNLLQNIDDNSIQFILIDPPYGCTAQQWDNILPFDLLWKEFNRIGSENYVCGIFGSQPFTTKIISSNIDNFRYNWYWVKNQATNFFHAKRMPLRKVEEICIFGGNTYYPQITENNIPTNSAKGCSNGTIYHGKNKRNYSGGVTTRYPNNILEYKCVNNYHKLHPNQKPLELLEYLIKTYTKENDLVLDCVSGSGSTLLAAKNLNRQFIGIENNKDYYDIIIKRLE